MTATNMKAKARWAHRPSPTHAHHEALGDDRAPVAWF